MIILATIGIRTNSPESLAIVQLGYLVTNLSPEKHTNEKIGIS